MKNLIFEGPCSARTLVRCVLLGSSLLAAYFPAVAANGPLQQAYLKPSNTSRFDYYGLAVAISGGTAVVGSFNEDGSAAQINGADDDAATDAGAAYVYVRTGTNWAQQAYLKPADNSPGKWFGVSVAISGDTIVVGASRAEFFKGAAYVFIRTSTNWMQQARLEASNADWGDLFGRHVAISGDTIVVGAYHEQSGARGMNGDQIDNGVTNAGAAYIFVRSGTNWTQQAYLKPSNTGANNFFGQGVAISADTVIVGSQGESSNATGVNGNQESLAATNAGAVYVFVRTGTNWAQQAYLKAFNTKSNALFGYAVGISGDTAIVGAYGEDSRAQGVNGTNRFPFPRAEAGAAYVFVRDGTNWSQEAHLKGSDTDGGDWFGESVAISGDTALVGAKFHDLAYAFVRRGNHWTQKAQFAAASTRMPDYFGDAVALSGDTAVIGASLENSFATGVNGNANDLNGWNSGAAYVFTGVSIGPTLKLTPDTAAGYRIDLRGSPGIEYELEQASAVLGPWTPAVSVQADNSGVAAFRDTNSPPGQRFYRVRQP